MTLAGAAAMLDLRLLGIAPRIPLASLRTLFPLMWGGFWLNLVSGSMLFASEATSKGSTPMFFFKLGLVAVGVATIVLIRREVYGKTEEPAGVSRAARNLAIVSLVAWVGAITAGRPRARRHLGMNPFGNPATLAHLHLLINHVPTAGTVLGVGLFLLAVVRSRNELKVISLEVFYLIALGSIPAYMSGVAAHGVLQQGGGAPEAAIAAHQSAALIALFWMELTGVVAWFGLWQSRRHGRPAQATLAVGFVLSIVSLATMAWAANLGGFIRHPEILATAANASSGTPWPDVPAMGEWILAHMWMWPTLETLHFVGMSLSFGVLLVMNLYLLGFMRSVSFADVHRLLPWGMLGLTLNVATGMTFLPPCRCST